MKNKKNKKIRIFYYQIPYSRYMNQKYNISFECAKLATIFYNARVS